MVVGGRRASGGRGKGGWGEGGRQNRRQTQEILVIQVDASMCDEADASAAAIDTWRPKTLRDTHTHTRRPPHGGAAPYFDTCFNDDFQSLKEAKYSRWGKHHITLQRSRIIPVFVLLFMDSMNQTLQKQRV